MEELRTPPPSEVAADPGESRRIPALLAGYATFGMYWGAWVILVAELNRDHGLSYGANGLLLALLSIVAVLVMAFVAPRLTRYPLGALVAVSLMALGVAAIAMAVLPTRALWIAFVLVGVGNGLIDVFLNVEAQRVEVSTGRPVLQWLHASYAAGGVAGALLGGIVVAAGIDYRTGIAATGLALFLSAWWNARRGSLERGSPEEETATFSLSAFTRHPALWVPALVVAFAFLVEGSMDTWSGLYLQDQLGASAVKAAVAFAAFSTSLCLGRLFAGGVLFGLGRRATIVISGAGAAVGGAIAALTDSTAVVAVAFLLMGFAISSAAPAAFGLVDEAAPGDQANGVAAVTTVGYSGFVWSPPIFGWIATAFDLRAAMTLIVVSTVGIIGAGLAAPRGRTPSRSSAATAG
ncbi:MAG TPA: MFS transporter [Actinomycetota bacterium]|nr:MFS transporter [Actinomycetota bacterium]